MLSRGTQRVHVFILYDFLWALTRACTIASIDCQTLHSLREQSCARDDVGGVATKATELCGDECLFCMHMHATGQHVRGLMGE